MALNVTMDEETKNINKTANLVSANGDVVGALTYNTTNQKYAGINFVVNISNKEEFVANSATYKTDIENFLDAFIANTVEIHTPQTTDSETE